MTKLFIWAAPWETCILGVPIRSYTNWSVPSQKSATDLGSRWTEKHVSIHITCCSCPQSLSSSFLMKLGINSIWNISSICAFFSIISFKLSFNTCTYFLLCSVWKSVVKFTFTCTTIIMSRGMRKPAFWVTELVRHKWAVQSQIMAINA